MCIQPEAKDDLGSQKRLVMNLIPGIRNNLSPTRIRLGSKKHPFVRVSLHDTQTETLISKTS